MKPPCHPTGTAGRLSCGGVDLRLLRNQLALVGSGAIGCHPNVEGERFPPRLADLHLVAAGLELEPLESTVEVVHLAGVIAVDEHLGIAWFHLEPQAADIVRPAIGAIGWVSTVVGT